MCRSNGSTVVIAVCTTLGVLLLLLLLCMCWRRCVSLSGLFGGRDWEVERLPKIAPFPASVIAPALFKNMRSFFMCVERVRHSVSASLTHVCAEICWLAVGCITSHWTCAFSSLRSTCASTPQEAQRRHAWMPNATSTHRPRCERFPDRRSHCSLVSRVVKRLQGIRSTSSA